MPPQTDKGKSKKTQHQRLRVMVCEAPRLAMCPPHKVSPSGGSTFSFQQTGGSSFPYQQTGCLAFHISRLGCLAFRTSRIRSFIWPGQSEISRKCPVAWKKTCIPINRGGFNVINLEIWNVVSLLKCLWNLCRKADNM
ncbi:hypothetical protein KIW84_020650 [Lathyrus oleraceus]|uniref:Uncharacterized protein n=1 Tax=Pisum sativum TaxID=3888 RepID=A0A9D4YA61_PEA|nr:hypothetical protein KIW84_020650 [Pisum sativum]